MIVSTEFAFCHFCDLLFFLSPLTTLVAPSIASEWQSVCRLRLEVAPFAIAFLTVHCQTPSFLHARWFTTYD